jgi:hypothetical protein
VAVTCLIRGRRSATIGSGVRPDSRLVTAIALMKIGFGGLVLWAPVRVPYIPNRVVMLGTPCAWLILMRPSPTASLARLVMAAVAVLQILQIYPVPGSQLAFGSLAVVPAAMTCLADGFAWYRGATGLAGAHRRRRSITAAAVVTAYVTGIAVFVFAQTYGRYAEQVPLGLPGAEWVRAPEPTAAAYRQLTATIRASADSFVAPTGMNSLYLWSGESPPNRTVIGSELKLFTPAEQLDIYRALMSHAHPMVISDTACGPEDDAGPLMREIGREFRVWRQGGRYNLLVPKATPVESGRPG